MQVKILTHREKILEADSLEVSIPASDGYLGIFKGHAPLIAKLGVGVVTVKNPSDTGSFSYFVSLGMFRVVNDEVEILADVAETKGQIDLARAEASKQRAEKRLKEANHAEVDIVRASSSLCRALARISFVKN